MAQEFEAKFLDVDKKELEVKLQSIGAIKQGDFFFKAIAFDYPGFPLDKKNAWVRLRSDGTETTLAYKERLGVKGGAGDDAGMHEVETTVSDFDTARALLLSLGLVEKFVQEKKRTSWRKGDVVYDIDEWPRLPAFLEIEAPSWEQVDHAAIELNFSLADKKICSATQVYGIYGIRDKDYVKMTFDEWIKR